MSLYRAVHASITRDLGAVCRCRQQGFVPPFDAVGQSCRSLLAFLWLVCSQCVCVENSTVHYLRISASLFRRLCRLVDFFGLSSVLDEKRSLIHVSF